MKTCRKTLHTFNMQNRSLKGGANNRLQVLKTYHVEKKIDLTALAQTSNTGTINGRCKRII